MYFLREIGEIIKKTAETFSVITVTGPRQSGKTTLLKNIFPSLPYFSLENPDTRLLALNDPRGFFDTISNGAILDEIQNAPELLSYLQGIVDSKTSSLYVLSGSSNFTLIQSISQSLAGRTAVFKLLPFSFKEIENELFQMNDDEIMLQGFYPALYDKIQNQTIYYRSYYETYLERDVRQLINLKDLRTFQLFIKLCAGRIGTVLNTAALSNEVGVSAVTIKQWLGVLEASYIIYLLPPYFENFGKRLIKMPKLYFTDTGLATYLLGIENEMQLQRDPLRGALFENMIVIELLKQRLHKGLDSNLFFYRDSNQNEIDIILKQGSSHMPIEIKSAKTFTPNFLKTLQYAKSFLKEKMVNPTLIYAGEQEQIVNGNNIVNYKKIRTRLL